MRLLQSLRLRHIIKCFSVESSLISGTWCIGCGCANYVPNRTRSQCRNCPHDETAHAMRNERRVSLIVQELAACGDLFVLIKRSGRFSEELARLYFRQLINGVEYLHQH